jgi:acyl-CoA synthetase (AMP-forming)/AMP-acid ligase II
MLIPMADVPRWYAERKKDAVAVSHGGDALTWDQLERGANRRARAFAAKGVKPGDFVAIGLPNSNAFFETSFAVWKLGATPTSLSWRLPRGEAAAVLDILKPALVVGGEADWNAPNSVPLNFTPEGVSDEPLNSPVGTLLEGDDQRRLDGTAQGDPRSSTRRRRHRGPVAGNVAGRGAAQPRSALSQRPIHRDAFGAVRRR